MAATKQSSSVDSFETCILCLDKHDRMRPSFCQCKHCSIPLCFDCMKEHHEELLQDVAQISHQYNELQQLIQTKQIMITDETAKSIEDVNRYFDAYINQLRDTQKKIIANMKVAKQNGQVYVGKVDADLRLVGSEIQGLVKGNVVQTAKMKTVSTKLKEIEQNLKTYRVTRIENTSNTQPNISIRFDCSPIEMKVNEVRQIDPQVLPPKVNTLNTVRKPSVTQTNIHQLGNDDHHEGADDISSNYDDDSDSDHTEDDNRHIDTSYNIDRMASDGVNILYSTHFDGGPDCIAYRCKDDVNGEEEYREWYQHPIEDMIWWDRIRKFVCATSDGIYTVQKDRKGFKILSVIRGNWSYIRVAANSQQLFVWMNCKENGFNGIGVYSTEFKFIRAINFDTNRIGSFVYSNSSFCATDNLIASICIRMKNNRQVFQVTFCDLDMKKLFSVPLGPCNYNIEIRTDGNDQFFIITGRGRFYIVFSCGNKEIISLQDDGHCIAVLKNQRVAVSGVGNSMEIVTY